MDPPVSAFKLTESEPAPGFREIRVEGELDLAVAEQLRQALRRDPQDQVLINLGSCEFIDSTGIAVILRAHRDGDGRVVIHSPGGQVLRVLEVSGLIADGLVFGDREQAMRRYEAAGYAE
jgi:anti-anti-sigma factor